MTTAAIITAVWLGILALSVCAGAIWNGLKSVRRDVAEAERSGQ